MNEPVEERKLEPSVSDAVRCMRTEGYLTLDEVVNPGLINRARQTFVERYSRFLEDEEQPDALVVGTRRRMVTLRIEPPFDDAQFLANPRLLPIFKALLGEDCVLGSFGVVCSLPGAEKQHVHRDGILFPDAPIDGLVPVFAITMAMPLLEMNEVNGTTALFPASHLRTAQEPTGPTHEPHVREGGCVLWDYRLAHAGTPNRGSLPRPLLYATYCRPWFLDYVNFQRQQKPLLVDDSVRSSLGAESQRLLVRVLGRQH